MGKSIYETQVSSSEERGKESKTRRKLYIIINIKIILINVVPYRVLY